MAESNNTRADPRGGTTLDITLSADVRKKLDYIRAGDETYAIAIERMIGVYKAGEDKRVGKVTVEMWEELDSIREAGEAYIDVVHRLVNEHHVANASYTVYLTKSLKNDLDVIRGDGETMLSTIERIVDEREKHDDAQTIYITKSMQDDLNPLLEDGEPYAEVVHRLIEEHIAGYDSYDVYLTKPMMNDIEVIRDSGESVIGVIARLINEHLTAEKQREMTPLGSTAALRIKPSTLDCLIKSAQDGDNYDDVVVRVLNQRDAYRIVAEELVEEGQRLQHNAVAVVTNLKTMISELIAIDQVVDETADFFDVDVDEIVNDAVDRHHAEGDDQ